MRGGPAGSRCPRRCAQPAFLLLLFLQIEKAKPIKCATFGAASLQQRHLATGDFAGSLSIW